MKSQGKELFIDKTPPKRPKLKILLGLPGSGKGTITKKYHLINNHTISVNYDELIMSNKSYQEEKKMAKTKKETQALYFKYREMVKVIDQKANAKAIKYGYSILWETTGSDIEWIYEWLHKFHKKGYSVEIHYPIADLKTIKSRLE